MSRRTSWKKGQSGNPAGIRKVEQEVRDLALSYASDAIKRLSELITSSDLRVSVKACEVILDRALGKPRQSIELGTIEDRPFEVVRLSELSDSELEALENLISKAVPSSTNANGKRTKH